MLGLSKQRVIREATPGTYEGGQYVPGETREFTVLGSVQPANPREVELLEEGARTRARWSMYCPNGQEVLKGTDPKAQMAADRVLYRSPVDQEEKEYEVHPVSNHTGHTTGIPHMAYVLVEVGADEPKVVADG